MAGGGVEGFGGELKVRMVGGKTTFGGETLLSSAHPDSLQSPSWRAFPEDLRETMFGGG